MNEAYTPGPWEVEDRRGAAIAEHPHHRGRP